MANKTQNEAIAKFNTTADENDVEFLWKLPKQIQKEIFAHNWEFTGSLESF